MTRLIRDDPYKEKYDVKVTLADFKAAFSDSRMWMHVRWFDIKIHLVFSYTDLDSL